MNSTKSIKTLISNYFEEKKIKDIKEILFFEKEWKNIVGETISNNTKIIKFTNGILKIKASNPTWRNELEFQKSMVTLYKNNHFI